MSQDTPRDQMSKKRVVYAVPGMEAVPVRRDEPYRVTDAGPSRWMCITRLMQSPAHERRP